MSTYIYSTKIVCIGTQSGSLEWNFDIGFRGDVYHPENPPVILWSESRLANDSGDGYINGEIAYFYAPIITEMGDIETTFDIDNSVVQNSGVDFTIANHDKIVPLLQARGIVLAGLPIQISLNEFDSGTGVLISSAIKFYGVIAAVNFSETELNISCESNMYNRKSRVLKEGEMLTVGASDGDIHFALNKKSPEAEVLRFLAASTFLVLGYKRIVSLEDFSEVYTYQIHSPINLATMAPESYAKIGSSWAFISDSPTSSKGEYRKIISFAAIAKTDLYTGYAPNLPDDCYYQFFVEGFYSNNMMVAGTPQAEPDLQTFVQFVNVNFEYELSKLTVSGTIDDIYLKSGETVSNIPKSGWNIAYSLYDNHIVIDPKFLVDQKTALTYTTIPCPSINPITDKTLIKWQHSKVDDANLYGKMFKLESDLGSGTYYDDATTICMGGTLTVTNSEYLSDRIFSHKATVTTDFNCNGGKCLFTLELGLPEIPDGFKFKACYLGIILESHSTVGQVDPGVKIISKEKYGNAKVIAAFKMNENWNGGSMGGVISTVPPHHFTTFDIAESHYRKDWQEEYIEAEPDTGMKYFTNYKRLKIDVSTIEEYRRLYRIGMFFARGETGENTLTESITITEACIIFEHENDLTEAYL